MLDIGEQSGHIWSANNFEKIKNEMLFFEILRVVLAEPLFPTLINYLAWNANPNSQV